MKVKYIISDTYRYDLITPIAGKPFADSLLLETIKLSEVKDIDSVYILDTRLSNDEHGYITTLINLGFKIIYYVIDLHERELYTGIGPLILSQIHKPNVYCFTCYDFKITSRVIATSFPDKIFHIPLAYQKSKEVDLTEKYFGERINKLLLTGFISDIYPHRLKLVNLMNEHPNYISRLRHPGYDNASKTDGLIGDAYIKALSSYRFMFNCGSKDYVELLKYNESAYAGCLSVGLLPTTYLNEGFDDLMYELDPFDYHFEHKIIKLMNVSNDFILGKVDKLRIKLHETRSPRVLNDKIKSIVNKIFK